jgi:polysaccharide export outer membrane protein
MRTDVYKPLLVMLIFLLVGTSLIFSSGQVLGQEDGSELKADISDDYRLGAGDLIRVVVWKNEEISGEYRVRPDGKISMPLVGDILAEDSTVDEVSMQVTQKLKLFIENPYVSAILVEATSNRVYVLGEVKRPGTYPINGSLTVIQAIAIAGGFSTFANKEKMVLIRGFGEEQKRIPLSYGKILRDPGEKMNPILQRGDTLVVP